MNNVIFQPNTILLMSDRMILKLTRFIRIHLTSRVHVLTIYVICNICNAAYEDHTLQKTQIMQTLPSRCIRHLLKLNPRFENVLKTGALNT